MGIDLYFAYGHNTNDKEMAKRISGAVKVGVGHLDNYELCLFRFAGIKKKLGSKLHGVVWSLAPNDWATLDGFECIGVDYTRILKKIVVNGVHRKAYLYEQTPHTSSACPPRKYIGWLRKGYSTNKLPLKPLNRAVNGVLCSRNRGIKTLKKSTLRR